MSKFKNKLASLILADLKDDISPDGLKKSLNFWGVVSPVTFFLLDETHPQYWSPIESAPTLNEAKKMLLQSIENLNNKYENDPDFSHWSTTQMNSFKLKVNKAKNISALMNAITTSDHSGAKGKSETQKGASLKEKNIFKEAAIDVTEYVNQVTEQLDSKLDQAVEDLVNNLFENAGLDYEDDEEILIDMLENAMPNDSDVEKVKAVVKKVLNTAAKTANTIIKQSQ